jgi:hypothetical protein
MDRVWTALQPSLSAVRDVAKKNGYITKIFFSTTPNGVSGTGEFFYQTWTHGWDYEEIFDTEKEIVIPEAPKKLLSDSEKNNFVRVKVHWSEVGRDENWYQQQIKELGFNMRKVNQELNLVFLGSTNTVFPDEILEMFEPKHVLQEINLAYGEKFKLYKEINPKKLYLLGVDTAASTAAKSDYCALVLTDAETGEEVGSWHGKYSVVKRFAVVVKSLIKGLNTLFALDEDVLMVIIERNSFGLGVVEDLLFSDDDFDYASYLYYFEQANGNRIPGFQTNSKSREMIMNFLLSMVNEYPTHISSALLQEELRNLEQKANGRIEAGGKDNHDDAVLAYGFTLYVRNQLIKDGIVTEDGLVSKLDSNRLNYFLDVTMSTSDPGLTKPAEEFQNIIHDEKKVRKKILKEMGYDKDYEIAPIIDNYIVF